jgi:hypothetical protein
MGELPDVKRLIKAVKPKAIGIGVLRRIKNIKTPTTIKIPI